MYLRFSFNFVTVLNTRTINEAQASEASFIVSILRYNTLTMWFFERPARRFFTKEEEKRILSAIQQAELNSTGEIRLHLENRCKGKDAPVRSRQLFQQLEMGETSLRNGVLIYIAVLDHRFAICADDGIDTLVPDQFWKEVALAMQNEFREKRFVEGVVGAIESISLQLGEHFPRTRSVDKTNQLPDEISYG